MTTHRVLFFTFALALLGTPALGQDAHGHDIATASPQVGRSMMNDVESMMKTMMADPVISKRMNGLMATNPAFKMHVRRMRAFMSSDTGMMNGGEGMTNGASGMHSPMMSATARPTP
jgi:hypothetical protein